MGEAPSEADSRGAKGGDEILQGTVERVTYADATSLYTVLRVLPEPGYEPRAGFGAFRPERVTAVGRAEGPSAGLRVRLTGRWSEHRTHGQQFEFELIEVLAPAGRDGLVRYLSSDRFRGVGEKLAERIVDALGDRAIDRILEDPKQLARVRGLTNTVREGLVASLLAEAGSHRAQVFLRGLGLGAWQTSRVLKKFGMNCEELLRADPYLLANGISGIGFGTADRIAFALGLAPEDPRRVRAAIVQALRAGAEDGHTVLATERLLADADRLLNGTATPDALRTALDELARTREVVVEQPDGEAERAALPHLVQCETMLARNLAALVRSAPARALADERALAAAERRSGLELDPDQRASVLGLLATPLGLLTGGPGVGKTTILKLLVQLAHEARANVLLASPTGRAAKRLAEATSHPAQTLHRLLGYDPAAEGFVHNAQNPLEADLIVVDEISMLDVVLAHHLLKAIQPPTRLVFVGDPDQLPSVGPGNVLHDLIESGCMPVFRLTRIFRQAEHSLIVTNAHNILHGRALTLPPRGDRRSDFYFFPADDPIACAERVVDVVTRRVPETFGLRWIDDVQVIAPMYRGECGVDALNEKLRAALVHADAHVREVRQGERVWRAGDRVIHTRNDYEREIFNGDLGRIERIQDDKSLVVRFPEREVVYTGSEIFDLQPAFAITVHRSQGSEYPAVVLPLVTQHFMMLQRNLLYTAVTRARKLVVLVGSPRALQMAIDNADQGRRESALTERMRAALG